MSSSLSSRKSGEYSLWYHHFPRSFAQKWLGIGKWQKDKVVIGNLRAPSRLEDNSFSTIGKIVCLFRMIILFPITILALGIKSVDFFVKKSLWEQIASSINESEGKPDAFKGSDWT